MRGIRLSSALASFFGFNKLANTYICIDCKLVSNLNLSVVVRKAPPLPA